VFSYKYILINIKEDIMADYEKHTPTTDALDTLGTIISPKEKRDAIHLAVYPVKAGAILQAGDHVDLEGDVAVPTGINEGVGIVDPFLDTHVSEGEWFWLVIYPRQIHSLRHVWEHPAFPASGETDVVNPAAVKAGSEQWIRNWIDTTGGAPSYYALMEKVKNWVPDTDDDDCWDEGYLHFNGTDAHGAIPQEFWYHAGIVLDKTFTQVKTPTYFSCSC